MLRDFDPAVFLIRAVDCVPKVRRIQTTARSEAVFGLRPITRRPSNQAMNLMSGPTSVCGMCACSPVPTRPLAFLENKHATRQAVRNVYASPASTLDTHAHVLPHMQDETVGRA
jgi:hypothetical protein